MTLNKVNNQKKCYFLNEKMHVHNECMYIMRKRVKLLPVRVMSAKYTTIIPGILSLIHYNKQIAQSRIMDFSRPEIYLKEKKKTVKTIF